MMSTCTLLFMGLLALASETTSTQGEKVLLPNVTNIQDIVSHKMESDPVSGQTLVLDEDFLSVSNRSISTELDVARIFVNLFDAEESVEEFNSHDSPSNRGGRASLTDDKDEADIREFNTYVDSMLERMNDLIKDRNMDPLSINLLGQKRKKADRKQKRKGGKNKRRRGGKDKAKQGKNKEAQHRMTRDATLPTLDATGEDNSTEVAVSKEISSTENPRRGSQTGGDGTGLITSVPRRRKQGNKGRGQNRRRNDKKKEKADNGRKQQKGPMTMRGILSGLSTIRRTGNVSIRQRKGAKIISARFQLGPLQLEIIKKQFRTGKKPRIQKASASATQLEGRLNIRINADDTARVKKLRVLRPKQVMVHGSLSPQDKTRSKGFTQKFVRNGYKKMAPEVTMRLHKVARNVLNAGKRSLQG